MKQLTTIAFCLFSVISFSQNQNWKTNGNTIINGDYLGTDNNEPLIFKSNGNEGLRIKPNGELRIKNFDDNLYTGLVYVNTNGILTKLNFSSNANEVLLGNGTFGNISNVSGWSFSGGIASSTGKVVIGNISSTEKLNVDGNIIANGSISGTSINVVDIVGAGKEIKIMNSLCLKGQDVNIPGSRNMICGMNGDLYVQSTSNNYNTILNYGNTGKVGIGVIPTENFHVGVTAKFDAPIYTDKIYTNRITSEDSIIHIGDSSILFNQFSNRIYGSDNTAYKGVALGANTFPKGLHSIAIGQKVRADGTNSIVIGATDNSTGTLFNNIDNSLMIGFNSNISTLFVGPASGNNTVGNVGIGTSNPLAKFQIGNDYTSLSFGRADVADLNYGTSYIGFNAIRTNTGWNVKSDGGHNGGNAIISTINGGMYFVGIGSIENSGNTDQINIPDNQILSQAKLIIHPHGEVTIGTDCPAAGYNLGVKGGIITDEVNILITEANNCWPDYVFNDEYPLLTLKEVENYTTINKHLPGIPSAKEIENSGMNVVEMNMNLLKKTEEITLYLIEMDRKLDELKRENEELKTRINELEK